MSKQPLWLKNAVALSQRQLPTRENSFTYQGVTYVVPDLLAYLRNNSKRKSMSMKVDMLQRNLRNINLDQSRIDVVTLTEPAIVIFDEKLGWVILDGLHRLGKVNQLFQNSLRCYVVTDRVLKNYRESS